MENDSEPSKNGQNHSENKGVEAPSQSDENAKPDTSNPKRNSKEGRITPFKIAEFVLLVLVFIATATAAYYTKKQWETADDQEKRALRAYVGIAQHGIENFGLPNQVLKTTRENYGQTPARDLIMDFAHFDVVPLNAQFAPVFCAPVPSRSNTVSLFPTQETPFLIRGNPLSKQQADLVRDGTQYMMIYWGAIHYRDAFGVDRCTRYCFSFKGPSMTENDAELCLQHNDSY